MPGLGAPGGFIDIQFKLEGQQEVIGRLLTAGQKIKDMSPAWEMVGKDLLEDFAANFAAEGGLFGKGAWAQWSPLAAYTNADRVRKGFPPEHPILERTGEGKKSVTERGAPGNIFDVFPDHLEIGTTNPKMVWNHRGTFRNGVRHIPPRPVVGLTPQRAGWSGSAQGSIKTRLQNWIWQQFRDQGLIP